MIDFDKLDKKTKYLGLQYSERSFIAKQIKRFSKCYAPNSEKIPIHVFALVYRLDEWWVYESHSDSNKNYGVPSGVRRYKKDIWLKIEKHQEEFEAYPLNIDFKSLEHYIGMPYSIGDIKSLLHAALHHSNGKQKDKKGLICSEYLALCYPDICRYFDLPAHCITPAHFQRYIEEKGIK